MRRRRDRRYSHRAVGYVSPRAHGGVRVLQRWCLIPILLFALVAGAARPAAGTARADAVPVPAHSGIETLPDQAMLAGYPQLYQQHMLTCEAAAASMATQGLVSESDIVASMPPNSDPWLGFRGAIDGHATRADGFANYGIYAPPLAEEMREFGFQTAIISGTSAPALLRYTIGVLHLPVVVWVTYRLRKEPTIVGHAGASTFPLVKQEHARLVVGYDAAGVYSHDPIDGPRYDRWPAFLRSWGLFDEMGLIVAPAFPPHDPPALSAVLRQHAAVWSWPVPPWPLADEVTIFRAGQPLRRFVVAPTSPESHATTQPPSPGGDDTPIASGASFSPLPLDAGALASQYMPVGALLAGARARSGVESLALDLQPSIPYTLTAGVVDPLGVASPVAVSPILEDAAPASSPPAPAPPPTAPIFPPASFFVLPASLVGGSMVISALRPQDLGSPTKPLTRIAYGIAATGLSYRVEIFASALDATTSFAWQMMHPPEDLVWLSAPPSPPGLRLYAVAGYVVAAVTYRNVEFVVSVPMHGGSASGAATVLTIARALVARSGGFSGSGISRGGDSTAAPIFPPPYTFIFGDLGAYSVRGVARRAQDERFYDYSFRPSDLPGAATRDYHVMVEPDAARALSAVAAATRTFANTYRIVGYHRVDLTGTALSDPALHAWTADVPALRCAVWAVFSYRNLWFLLGNSSPAAGKSCAAALQGTLALESRLLQTARAYVAAYQQ